MYDEHAPEYGSQASILSAVVKSLPSPARSTSSTGESSSEATNTESCYHTTRRSLLQTLQLSQVLLSAIDKTNQSLNDPEMMQGAGPLLAVEATKTRLLGFKELAVKSRALEQSALDALDGMGAPVTHDAVGVGLPPAGSGWMSLTEVALLSKGPVSSQQAETERVLQLENTKLRIKTEGLQRQVELLSSSLTAATTTSAMAAAQPEVSSPRTRAPEQSAFGGAHGDSAKMVAKLQRELEEKEELVVGLRRTVRDVANDRYPILEERDDLQRKMQTLLQSQARLLEDREALETHNARIESQLRRTADRCQELEAYVRSLEATLVAAREGGRGVIGLLPPISPSRSPMVHRPDVDVAGPLDALTVPPAATEAKESETAALHSIAVTDDEGGRPSAAFPAATANSPRQRTSSFSTATTPSFFLWLLSFFLEPHLDDDDEDDGPPAMIV